MKIKQENWTQKLLIPVLCILLYTCNSKLLHKKSFNFQIVALNVLLQNHQCTVRLHIINFMTLGKSIIHY